MDSRVSVISIIIKDEEAAVTVNELLHEFRNYIVGRMGIPVPAERSVDHQCGAGRAGRCDKLSFRKTWNVKRSQCKDTDCKVVNTTI